MGGREEILLWLSRGRTKCFPSRQTGPRPDQGGIVIFSLVSRRCPAGILPEQGGGVPQIGIANRRAIEMQIEMKIDMQIDMQI